MAKEIKNVGASVRARLLQLAKASGQSFELVLTRFALERLLFRLSLSPHADRFVLKGAMLMMSWFDDPHRGTRDLDLLGFGDPSAEPMLATFREILAQDAGDGVEFDADALRVDRIREQKTIEWEILAHPGDPKIPPDAPPPRRESEIGSSRFAVGAETRSARPRATLFASRRMGRFR